MHSTQVVSHWRGPHLLNIAVLEVADGLFGLCGSERLGRAIHRYRLFPPSLTDRVWSQTETESRQVSKVHVSKAAPVHVSKAAPVHVSKAAPVHVSKAAPVHVSKAAPVHVSKAAPVHVSKAAPVHVNKAAPVHVSNRSLR